MSHSPLFGYKLTPIPKAPQEAEIREALAGTAARVAEFKPDLAVLFGPDHFQGFFYDVMPMFCVGVHAHGAGDYGGPTGPVLTEPEAALSCADHLVRAGFDPAVSHDMRLDHGYTQPLKHLFGGIDRVPVIPVYVNAVAPPRATLARVMAFGEAIGRWAAESGKRVLLVGSGGLSHDPPVPSITDSPPEVREFMIEGGALPEDARRAREARIVEQAVSFGQGGSELQQLNPDWDRWLLDRFEAGALEEIAAQSDADVTREGGRAGHEIRTWIAAFSALASQGRYDARTLYYAPVPEWLVAMGLMEAAPAA